jgi:predicted butyrate kinase (DUF1464 family)
MSLPLSGGPSRTALDQLAIKFRDAAVFVEGAASPESFAKDAGDGDRYMHDMIVQTVTEMIGVTPQEFAGVLLSISGKLLHFKTRAT